MVKDQRAVVRLRTVYVQARVKVSHVAVCHMFGKQSISLL